MYSYLALGDSYTIGEAVPKEENFPHQTTALLRAEGFDLSDPVIIATTGWTTNELADVIQEHHLDETFSFVTLLIGVNNQYRGLDLEDYKKDFERLLNTAINFANGHSRKVFVLSIPDWGVTPFAEGRDRGQIATAINDFNSAAKEITDAHTAVFLDITDSTRENGVRTEFLAEDGLHPSGKEYAVWSQRLAPMVAKALKS